ncbi:hypothetical protein MN116_008983 [Schistosoma mekongi]|uniref:EF-hand domain-containing protein n=1 Tax=Schistosoma mekongi TaxID=38744 RepID=A0AAE2D197_SCHME|nr:hypothetical protein MN116_008983 [Schistosoma mekongi]
MEAFKLSALEVNLYFNAFDSCDVDRSGKLSSDRVKTFLSRFSISNALIHEVSIIDFYNSSRRPDQYISHIDEFNSNEITVSAAVKGDVDKSFGFTWPKCYDEEQKYETKTLLLQTHVRKPDGPEVLVRDDDSFSFANSRYFRTGHV